MLSSIDSLRCFCAAASTLNFGTAAAKVALSPTAFSERIKRLEEDLGKKLFERSTRHVRLSAHGVRLLPRALQLIRDAERLSHDDESAAPFTLTLGTRFELGMSWILPQLAALKRAKPERKLHLAFGDAPDLLSKVKNGRLDAMIASLRLTSRGLSYGVLHEEAYVFVGAARGRPLRRVEDAQQHTLIDAAEDLPLFRYFLDAFASEQLWSFKDVECLGTIAAVRYRVLEGDGVAVLPLYFVRDDLRAKRLVRLFPRITLPTDHFRLVWRSNHPLQTELSALASELRQAPLR